MWGGVSLDEHIMVVHGSDNSGANANTAASNPTTANTQPNTTPSTTTTSPRDTSGANTNTAANNPTTSNTQPNTTPSTNTTSYRDTVAPGDCVEVWWEGNETWYRCAITDQDEDYDGSLVSLCHYDDERKGRWHNLEVILL